MSLDSAMMQRAYALAQQAQRLGEVPVGCVITLDDNIIAEGFNQPIAGCDPTAHAEIVALRKASQAVQNYRLINTTMYVTLEPCVMCIGALVHARVKRLVFGASDPKAGAVVSQFNLAASDVLNHKIVVQSGVMEEECGELLRAFFKERRKVT